MTPDDATAVQAVPVQGGAAPAPEPWADYLAAAQRLDAVRRSASDAAGEQAQALQAARQELDGVRARLAPQRARLVRDFGVPESSLTPLPAELAAATQAVAGGPAAALAALRQARGTADAADAATLRSSRSLPSTPWARNLLVYGPFAFTVLVVQMALYLAAPSDGVGVVALVCGLAMPVLAFGLAWATIGWVFGGQGTAVDRTPLVGAAVCAAPVVASIMVVGVLAVVG